MQTKDKVLWYVLGAVTGWIAFYLIFVVGGFTLTMLGSFAMMLWPVLLIGGVIGAAWYFVDKAKNR